MEIAPPYAGTLFGITNSVANICGFVAPYAVGSLVQGNVSESAKYYVFSVNKLFVIFQQTVGQWRLVFLIAAGVYTVSNTIFMIFGSSQVQPWAECEDIGEDKSRKVL